MKREELLKENFSDMKTEFLVSHHNICRKIDAIFAEEIKHFRNLLNCFNEQYQCIEKDKLYLVSEKLENIFNSCKVILVNDYEVRFNKNMELLTSTMYDFFIRKISNENTRCPIKELNKYLVNMCKFDCFIIEDTLEDKLIDFSNDFSYRYVNSEDEQRDFDHLIKNLNHSLMCELKKAIAASVNDKQDITMRYNTMNKEVLTKVDNIRK